MSGAKLTEFCKSLCIAIKDGTPKFLFDGESYETNSAQHLADSWILAEKNKKRQDGGTGGIPVGVLSALGARPGVGKSTSTFSCGYDYEAAILDFQEDDYL